MATGRYWAPSSPGDLADRLTILKLKVARCPPGEDVTRAVLTRRLAELTVPAFDAETLALVDALSRINEALWDLEDTVRATMAAGDAHDRFVHAARCIPILNDTRNHVKKRIDQMCGYHDVQDVKLYNCQPCQPIKPPL